MLLEAEEWGVLRCCQGRKNGRSTILAVLISLLMVVNGSAVAADVIRAVKVSAIHPTQPAIGVAEVKYQLAQYQQQPRELFDDFCQLQGAGHVVSFSDTSTLAELNSFQCAAPIGSDPQAMKSAVIAPDGQVYLTDGHHSVSALRASEKAGAFTLSLRITEDFRHLPTMDSFWDEMQQRQWVWLSGPQGKLDPQVLPAQVGLDFMQDDPYRSVIYFLRGVAYDKPKQAQPFLEFYLGTWLQSQLPITAADTATQPAYYALLQQAAQLITQASPDSHSLSDTASPTLNQLGQRREINRNKLHKLNKVDGKLSRLFSIAGQ